MAETPESMQSQAEADPATLAFEALREEVAFVRRAVAWLAAERASIEIPDYSETLGQIMRVSSATRQSVKALAKCQGCVFRPKTGATKSRRLPKKRAVPTSKRSQRLDTGLRGWPRRWPPTCAPRDRRNASSIGSSRP